jgi:hypothetical protein
MPKNVPTNDHRSLFVAWQECRQLDFQISDDDVMFGLHIVHARRPSHGQNAICLARAISSSRTANWARNVTAGVADGQPLRSADETERCLFLGRVFIFG